MRENKKILCENWNEEPKRIRSLQKNEVIKHICTVKSPTKAFYYGQKFLSTVCKVPLE